MPGKGIIFFVNTICLQYSMLQGDSCSVVEGLNLVPRLLLWEKLNSKSPLNQCFARRYYLRVAYRNSISFQVNTKLIVTFP